MIERGAGGRCALTDAGCGANQLCWAESKESLQGKAGEVEAACEQGSA